MTIILVLILCTVAVWCGVSHQSLVTSLRPVYFPFPFGLLTSFFLSKSGCLAFWIRSETEALFRSIFFFDFDTVTISFLFDKHYLIMKQLGLKDSSRDLQVNCAISYLFYLHLMFHACAAKFDVTENLVKFWVFGCI